MPDESTLSTPPSETGGEHEEFLTLDETVQFLGTSKATLYRWLGQGDLKGMKVGRQWRFRKADLIAYMERGPVAAAMAPAEAMETELSYFAEQFGALDVADVVEFEEESTTGKSAGAEPATTGESKVTLLLRRILALAAAKGVSDIHLEPVRQGGDSFGLLRFRLDGVLHEMRRLPLRIHEALVLSIKQQAEMNLAERKLPQDGRCTFWHDSSEFDTRVSCLPTLYGEAITMRLLDRQRVRIGLDQVGLMPENLTRLRAMIEQPDGLILAAGPSGSGKSTLLYSCLHALVNSYRKTLTVEDPVELVLPYATQTQVNHRVGLTFPVALRSSLRQDPDILMLGEMRDRESAELIVAAANTGHLCFSALHTANAPAALIRLREIGVEPFLIVQAVRCVLAQRLARTVCPHCKEPSAPARPDIHFARIQQAAAAGGYTVPPDATFYRGRGCEHCFLTGYQGRIGVFELMVMTPEVRQAFMSGASAEELTQVAVAHGMRTLIADGLRKAAEGLTTPEEAWRVAWG